MLNRIVNQFTIRANIRQKLHYLSKYKLLSLFLNQNHLKNSFRCLTSTESEINPKNTIFDTFRTNESNPLNHSTQHLSMYYTIPSEMANKLFILGGFDKEQQITFKTFKETTIMVRRPALEVMKYLQIADYSRPVNRYILWGPIGAGKTFTLNHILHFGFQQKFLLLYSPNPTDWVRYPEETAQSQFKPERIDTPIDAALWLQHFRTHNSHLLDELDLKVSKQYVWSQREVTEPGDPLKSILEHGINRIKHASDCMAVLIKEIKAQASEGKCRVLVVADRVNVFYEKSKIKYPDRSIVEVDNITIARAFKQLFTNDWRNGAVVVSVCKKIIAPYRIHLLPSPHKVQKAFGKPTDSWGPFSASHLSDLPKDLLTDRGFKDFDPFVPIEVSNYDEKEMESCLNYYNDRHWLQRPATRTPEGRNEIKFLSAFNPLETYEICSSL